MWEWASTATLHVGVSAILLWCRASSCVLYQFYVISYMFHIVGSLSNKINRCKYFKGLSERGDSEITKVWRNIIGQNTLCLNIRPVQKVSSLIIWKIETVTEEDTTYKKHCTQDRDASVPFEVGTLRPNIVLPIIISSPLHFPESHQQSEISSLLKVISVWGKARSCRAPNLGYRGLSYLGDLIFYQKTAWDVIHEWVWCHDEAANHQLPVFAAFGIIFSLAVFGIVSTEECSSLMQNSVQICLLYSFSHFEFNDHIIYMFTQ